MKENPKEFEFDYDGSCAPEKFKAKGWSIAPNQTFSVGIFQWIPKKYGEGLKRSRVMKRMRGYSNQPEELYERAGKYVATLQREHGFVLHPKLKKNS